MNSTPSSSHSEPLDLAGDWRFRLDPNDAGETGGFAVTRLSDTVKLPGTVAEQGFGDPPSLATQWTCEMLAIWTKHPRYKQYQTAENFRMPFWLQPPRIYQGAAWFQRTIEIPSAWAGRRVVLFLERPHWATSVWLDGVQIGTCDRLGVPHVFVLGTDLQPGPHTLTLRVDNRMIVDVGVNSHSVSDHTQGNWNGIVGRIELSTTPSTAWIDDVRIVPSVAKLTATVHIDIGTAASNEGSATKVSAVVRRAGPAPIFTNQRATADAVAGQATIVFDLGADAVLWDEFSPNLYEVEVTLHTAAGDDTRRVRFGLREVGVEGTRITVNGRKIFLRGTLDCAAFPLTGYPPTEKPEWLRIFSTIKAHGLNHVRFHSWCPPEAAFDVADELGIYCQIECSSWANQGAEIGSGRTLDAWLDAEADAIVRRYGNHPSFLLMAYGNEPAGPHHIEWLTAFVARWKAKDNRRLYTTGAGWPVVKGSDFHCPFDPRIQGWGQELKSIINAQPPRSDYDWSDWVRTHPDAPTVSHEIGQWCAYPDFDEIARYTGWFRAANFEIFREQATRAGLLPYARDFLAASGRLQVLCYKADIEAALRTPGFGGFQLLGLNDFPGQGTALVGVLNAFWESKGYTTPEEFRGFSGPVVPLVRLKKMIFTEGETLDAAVELAQFGADVVTGPVEWILRDAAGAAIAQGRLIEDAPFAPGELHALGSINLRLPSGPARKLVLEVGLPQVSVANSWEIWVYPGNPTIIDQLPAGDRLKIVETLDTEAEAHLASGGDLLWLPPADTVAGDPAEGPVKMGFSSIFWNTVWTGGQAPHTLGILCDPAHPALADFPTESHSNWQWWDLVHNAAPFILTAHPEVKPIVQVIDDWVTARKLGLIFETRVGNGRLLACSANLRTDLATRPAARQMRASLLRYMAGATFNPSPVVDWQGLRASLIK